MAATLLVVPHFSARLRAIWVLVIPAMLPPL
jgi:hypothetical protein